MASQGSSSTTNPPTPARHDNTGSRPPQPNLLHDPDNFSESDEEQPPPYSRYDPLNPHPQETQGPAPQQRSDLPQQNTGPRSNQQPYPPATNGPIPISPQSPSDSPPMAIQGQWTGSPPPRQNTTPFQYPPGYLCQKCNNTGYKPYGSPCGSCARLFGKQTANVKIIPSGYQVIPPQGALVVPSGDPRLGGILCGNCKGTGSVSLLFFESTFATELEEYVKYHLSVYLMLGISTYMFYSGTLHIMWERPSSIK